MNTINNQITRQIFLDTETTGMNYTSEHYRGHNIIEIGAVEAVDRVLTGNNFHVYLKPDRSIDPKAFSVHGISDEFLLDKPSFSEIVDDFLNYISNAELIIHNASFDVGFINYELRKLNYYVSDVNKLCKITDSLALARKIFPNKHNSLNALCSRYEIDRKKRTLHGALLDAQILANIYLAMTSGQISMSFSMEDKIQKRNNTSVRHFAWKTKRLRVLIANNKEITEHKSLLDFIQEKSGNCLWRQ